MLLAPRPRRWRGWLNTPGGIDGTVLKWWVCCAVVPCPPAWKWHEGMVLLDGGVATACCFWTRPGGGRGQGVCLGCWPKHILP